MTSTAYEGQKKKTEKTSKTDIKDARKNQGRNRMESVINMQKKTTKQIKITTIDINRTVFWIVFDDEAVLFFVKKSLLINSNKCWRNFGHGLQSKEKSVNCLKGISSASCTSWLCWLCASLQTEGKHDYLSTTSRKDWCQAFYTWSYFQCTWVDDTPLDYLLIFLFSN